MKNIAFICEYNPFHLGHLKQIEYIKDKFLGEEIRIICIMSGNFVQRGNFALSHKYKRAEFAVRYGADLVLEHPFPYCMGRAEDFAGGAVDIINSLGNIDYICCGSECADVERIYQSADRLSSNEFKSRLSERAKKDFSISYASLREHLYFEMYGEELLTTPNDVLALEYTQALIERSSKSKLIVNPRVKGYSATRSREVIGERSVDDYTRLLPEHVAHYYKSGKMMDFSVLDSFISLYFFLSDPKSFENVYEMNFDLASKIKAASSKVHTAEELVCAVSDKRYTKARVRRAILSSILGLNNSEICPKVPYTAVLGASSKGREYIGSLNSTIPVITRKAELQRGTAEMKAFELSQKADRLFERLAIENGVEILKKPYVIGEN